MKLVIILVIFVGGLAFCGWRVYDYFDTKAAAGDKIAGKSPEASADVPPVAPRPVQPEPFRPAKGTQPEAVTVVGSYLFKNRVAPEAPAFLRDSKGTGLIVQREEASNSWVWMGSAVLASQVNDLAAVYDVEQTEMDLEFCLVLINRDKMSEYGLALFYRDQVSWLDALSLQGDAGSLRISSGGWALELDMGNSDAGLTVVSQPVVRCVDGEPWEFTTDSEVPIPRSEIIDGAIRQSIEYRPVGFGLSRAVRILGDVVRLNVEQRNGSIESSAATDVEAPTLSRQTIATSLNMAWHEWSVLGGIQIDREELRKGLFRHSKSTSRDYLVVFVRPRLSLSAPPRAVPVVRPSSRDSHPLLPNKIEFRTLDDLEAEWIDEREAEGLPVK